VSAGSLFYDSYRFINFTFRAARQKTLSVKWHQSMSETRLCDKRYMSTRKAKEASSLRNRPQLPKLNDDPHEYVSRQESLPTATTPLMMMGNSNITAVNSSDNMNCDCVLPQDGITTTVKYRQNGHDTTAVVDAFGAKSESC
jgi:hypothetical protein